MKLRTIGIAILTFVILLAIGFAVVAGKIDSFRPKIQAQLQQKLNRQVDIGHLSLRLLPLSIKVESLTIGEDPAFASGRPFAKAGQVFVSAGLFSLIGGNPKVENVTLEQPQIELIKNAIGKWNFSSLGGQSSNSGSSSNFALDKLQITDGQVGYTDEQRQQARAVYDHIDLSLTDFAPDKKFGVALAVHFPGEGAQTFAFKGNAGPLPQGSSNALPPVDGHVSLKHVSLSGVNRFAAGAIPPQTDTVATGEADVTEGSSGLGLKGDLKLENTIIRGSKIDYPIQAKYDVSADQSLNKLQLTSTTLSLGPTTFKASGNVDNASKPATVNVQVSTKDSSITELAKLAGAFGVAFSPDYQIGGTLSVDLNAKGPVAAPQLNGTVSAANLTASGGEIKQPVSVAAVNLTLTPEAIHSNTFTVRSGATQLDVTVALANYTSKNPTADVTLKSAGANIAEILNMAKAYGVDAAKGMTGDGTMTLDVHAQGPTSDPSKLQFSGSASIQKANLTTPLLTKPLAIASADAQFSQNSAAISNLDAGLGSTNVKGSASVSGFSAPVVQFALSANKIDTDELQHLMAPSKPGPATPAKPTNSPSLLASSTGGGKLEIGTLKAQEIVLTNVSTLVQLNHGLITLSPVSSQIFGGSINGTISADMRPQTPLCSAKVKLGGIDANALMSAVSSMKNQLYGSLSGTSDIHFALASSNDLARTLNGIIAFSLAKGELKNVNIQSELAKAGKVLGNSSLTNTGSSTQIKELSGTLNIANGVATTNNLKGALDNVSLTATGTFNLVNQDVNMHATATLPGSSGLGIVLANNKGQTVVPVIVTGNMTHMNFVPDVAAMAKMRVGSLGGLLGIPTGQQQDGKQSPVDSILNGFTKKKP
jgi:AsmA protein